MKQLSLIKTNHEFGGSLLVGKRKEARPIATKKPMHIIFKSEKARGIFALINHKRAIESAIAGISRRYGVKIFKLSVNNNHIHLVTQFKSRGVFRAWVRVLSAEVVRTIARKTGRKIKDFFTQRPYTKIVNWGRHLSIALDYIVLNQMEYCGLRPTTKRGARQTRAEDLICQDGTSRLTEQHCHTRGFKSEKARGIYALINHKRASAPPGPPKTSTVLSNL